MRVHRIDLAALKPPTRRADGTLVADALLTRTGVFTYRNPDGSERKEYRPPREVFDQKSLDSFKLVPITDDHPPTMLTANNARQYAVGAVGENVRRAGSHVAATIAVHDAGTIAKMDAGKSQVSCGYDCELDETPGVSPEGERYDAVQTAIVGNHLAIVHNARAGSTAAVRMDAAVMVADAVMSADPDHFRETSDSWRYRVRPPAMFDQKSFRLVPLTDGVDAVMGKSAADGDAGAMHIQALIFSKKRFAVQASAAKWIDDHPDVLRTTDKARADYSDAKPTEPDDDDRMDMVVERDGKWFVRNKENTKDLDGPFDSKDEATKRLGQIEYFKSQPKKDDARDAHRQESKTMNLEQALAALAAANEKIGAEKSRADAAEKARDELKTKVDELKAKADSETKRADAAEKGRKDAIDAGPAMIRARVSLEKGVAAVLGEKLKRADGAEVEIAQAADRELKLAVIKHVDGDDCDLDEAGQKQSDVYIGARYDGAIKRAVKSAETFRGAQDRIDRGRQDAAAQRSDAAKEHDAMVERNRNAWQPAADTGATK